MSRVLALQILIYYIRHQVQSITPDCMEVSWLPARKRRKSKWLLSIHQHVLEQHQIINSYLRKTSISLWACLFSIRSMGNVSAVLFLLRGTQLMVLKDTIISRGDVQVSWDLTFNTYYLGKTKKVRYLSLKLKQIVSVVCAFRDVLCVQCCPLLTAQSSVRGGGCL